MQSKSVSSFTTRMSISCRINQPISKWTNCCATCRPSSRSASSFCSACSSSACPWCSSNWTITWRKSVWRRRSSRAARSAGDWRSGGAITRSSVSQSSNSTNVSASFCCLRSATRSSISFWLRSKFSNTATKASDSLKACWISCASSSCCPWSPTFPTGWKQRYTRRPLVCRD